MAQACPLDWLFCFWLLWAMSALFGATTTIGTTEAVTMAAFATRDGTRRILCPLTARTRVRRSYCSLLFHPRRHTQQVSLPSSSSTATFFVRHENTAACFTASATTVATTTITTTTIQKRTLPYATIPRGGSDRVDIKDTTETVPKRRRQQQPQNLRCVSYITDIEGDRDYLHRFVQQSRVLCFRDKKEEDSSTSSSLAYPQCIDFQHPERDVLVFGGDIWDQGGFDLYVIRQLLDLKQRYPNHVYFVLGNRDLNKMRIVTEIGTSDQNMPRNHPGVHWLRGTTRLGDPDCPNFELNDPVARLQWMLKHTMGSPRAFEYRKQELQEETKQNVSDADVVASYRSSCHPNGEMGLYLANAQLAVLLGNVLFVHGSLPMTKEILAQHDPNTLWEGDNLRFAMPWLDPDSSHQVKSVPDWILSLNDFASREIAEWRRQPPTKIWSTVGGYHNNDHGSGSGTNVMQYGMGWLPDKTRNPTIVYASWATNGMPRRFFPLGTSGSAGNDSFSRATRSFFQSSGIRFICSGHQPQGDMPNAIRVRVTGRKNAWILSCDTSYSGDVHWFGDDDNKRQELGREGSLSGRGQRAVSEVLLTQNMETGHVVEAICHGVLSDGTMYETKPLAWDMDEGDEEEDLPVGCLAQGPAVPSSDESPHRGPWWTRAAFTDGSCLLAAGEGFDVWNKIVVK